MAITALEKRIRETICPRCRNDRYNHAETENVKSAKCQLLGYVKQDRSNRQFVCPYKIPVSGIGG